ncbi:MAB_1171c family putative transporter [Nonomuraea sp. NPDC048901]|uniref:MAB_1171c family putative transporter n=1 Tax=Nonomuraea sp. NPDC048901 TaxID=3155627 RepID=UPI0033F51D98
MLYWGEASVIWTIAVQAAVRLVRKRRSPVDLAYSAHIVTLSLSVLVQFHDIQPRLDTLTHINGLGRWLVFSFTIASMCAFWITVTYLTSPAGGRAPGVTAKILWAAAGIAVMGVLLFGSGVPDDAGAGFLVVHGDNPLIVGSYLAFLAYISAGLFGTLRRTWRYVRYVHQPYVRLGLRLVAAGDAGGLLYVGYLSATALTSYFGLPTPPGASTHAVTYLGLACTTLIVAGPTIGVWGPRLATPLRSVAQRRALRRLRPLWTALTTAMPELRRDPPSVGDSAGYQLYRYVIEIRDSLLVLESYTGGPFHDGMTPALHAQTVVQALHTFAATKRTAAAPGLSPASAGDVKPAVTREATSGDPVLSPGLPAMKDELTHLTQLSRAFARL